MRIAVISDIHGNLEALIAALEDIDHQSVDQIFSLGDNVGYGADSEAVVQQMIESGIPSVLGNHELACVNAKVYEWYSGDVKKALNDTMAGLSPSSLAYIRSLAVNHSDSNTFYVHGFWPDSVRHYLHQIADPELHQTFDKMKESICFLGHTHRLGMVFPEEGRIQVLSLKPGRVQLEKDRKYIINAGSVGQPRDGDPRSKYVIWDSTEHCLDIRYLEYDHQTAAQKIISAGLPVRFARAVDPDIVM